MLFRSVVHFCFSPYQSPSICPMRRRIGTSPSTDHAKVTVFPAHVRKMERFGNLLACSGNTHSHFGNTSWNRVSTIWERDACSKRAQRDHGRRRHPVAWRGCARGRLTAAGASGSKGWARASAMAFPPPIRQVQLSSVQIFQVSAMQYTCNQLGAVEYTAQEEESG